VAIAYLIDHICQITLCINIRNCIHKVVDLLLLARLLSIIAFTSIADRYLLNLKPRSLSLPRQIQGKILEKIQLLENDLVGDVKKLTNFTPEYRLRVGNYRVLFEIEDTNIVIYRVKPRDKAYQ